MRRLSLCIFCVHLAKGLPMTCKAFPEGIPRRFALGDEVHVEPAEGDHGIQFELAEGLDESCRRVALKMVTGWKQRQQKPAAS
jgi:hypothetical protein